MKRKFKLFSSVISLGLAITLLMTGVLALANKREILVGGTVAFEAKGVDAEGAVLEGYGDDYINHMFYEHVSGESLRDFNFRTDTGEYNQNSVVLEGLGESFPLGDEIPSLFDLIMENDNPELKQEYVYGYSIMINNTGAKSIFVKVEYDHFSKQQPAGVGLSSNKPAVLDLPASEFYDYMQSEEARNAEGYGDAKLLSQMILYLQTNNPDYTGGAAVWDKIKSDYEGTALWGEMEDYYKIDKEKEELTSEEFFYYFSLEDNPNPLAMFDLMLIFIKYFYFDDATTAADKGGYYEILPYSTLLITVAYEVDPTAVTAASLTWDFETVVKLAATPEGLE